MTTDETANFNHIFVRETGKYRGTQHFERQEIIADGPQWYTIQTPNRLTFDIKDDSLAHSEIAPHVGGHGLTLRGGDNAFRLSVFRDTPTSQGTSGAEIGRYRFEAVNSNGNGTNFGGWTGFASNFNAGSETLNPYLYVLDNGTQKRPINVRTRYGYVSIEDGFQFRMLDSNANTTARLEPAGYWAAGNGAGYQPESLANRTPDYGGQVAIDDGTNTTSGNLELAVGQSAGGTWYTMGEDSI